MRSVCSRFEASPLFILFLVLLSCPQSRDRHHTYSSTHHSTTPLGVCVPSRASQRHQWVRHNQSTKTSRCSIIQCQYRSVAIPLPRGSRTHSPLHLHLGLLRPGHSTLRHLPLARSLPRAPRPPRPSRPRQNRRRSRTPPRARRRRRRRRGQQQRRQRRRHRSARTRSRVGAREPRP